MDPAVAHGFLTHLPPLFSSVVIREPSRWTILIRLMRFALVTVPRLRSRSTVSMMLLVSGGLPLPGGKVLTTSPSGLISMTLPLTTRRVRNSRATVASRSPGTGSPSASRLAALSAAWRAPPSMLGASETASRSVVTSTLRSPPPLRPSTVMSKLRTRSPGAPGRRGAWRSEPSE